MTDDDFLQVFLYLNLARHAEELERKAEPQGVERYISGSLCDWANEIFERCGVSASVLDDTTSVEFCEAIYAIHQDARGKAVA
jgi:hypothetical protein